MVYGTQASEDRPPRAQTDAEPGIEPGGREPGTERGAKRGAAPGRRPQQPNRRKGKRPRRKMTRARRIRRRIFRSALLVFLVVFGYVGYTVEPYLTYAGSDTLSARVAEWGRDHHLSWAVTWLENTTYKAPPTGGKLSNQQVKTLQGDRKSVV